MRDREFLVANALYDLPFGKGGAEWWRQVFGGWRAVGIITLQSGAPLTVSLSSATGQDVAQIGLAGRNNLECPNPISKPNQGAGTPEEGFNAAAFALPARDSFGTAGRNAMIGTDLAGIDVSMQKEAMLHDRAKLQFRLNVYNSLDHPNFALLGRIFGTANFGVISSARDAREMQAVVKMLF